MTYGTRQLGSAMDSTIIEQINEEMKKVSSHQFGGCLPSLAAATEVMKTIIPAYSKFTYTIERISIASANNNLALEKLSHVPTHNQVAHLAFREGGFMSNDFIHIKIQLR